MGPHHPPCRLLSSLFWIAIFLCSTLAYAADSLEGVWQHQKDSSGWKALKGANVTLKLSKNGKAILAATGPNQSPLNEDGTWSQNGGRITLNIPNEMELKNQSFQLVGDTLTLPVQAGSDKPGTSTWVRVRSNGGMDAIYAAFNRALDEGKGGATAAEDAATEARKQPDVEKVEVVAGGKALIMTVKAATPVKPKVYILFASKSAPMKPISQGKLPVSPLAADPRVRLVPQNPPGDPDVPKSKTALVISPFYSKVYYAYNPAIWKKGDSSKPQFGEITGKTSTFKDLGDDPQIIINILRDKAKYEVTSLIDDEATPGAIFRALQSKPSVIYFGTHGAPGSPEDKLNAVAAAGLVAARAMDKRPGAITSKQASEALARMLQEQGVPEAARAGVSTGCLEREGDFAFCFPLLWPKFFEVALGGHGAPDGFVFMDACYSAQFTKLAETFKAKTYFGYDVDMPGWSTARFAKYIFSNLQHKGHSAREAEIRLRHLTKGAGVVWLEDSILSPPIGKGDADLTVDATHLHAWGSDLKEYEEINNSVFWLMIMARMSNDINKGADALNGCLKDYWRTGKRPGLAAPFCNNGITGSHTPTAQEVEDASHLVSGKPTNTHGRFVLH